MRPRQRIATGESAGGSRNGKAAEAARRRARATSLTLSCLATMSIAASAANPLAAIGETFSDWKDRLFGKSRPVIEAPADPVRWPRFSVEADAEPPLVQPSEDTRQTYVDDGNDHFFDESRSSFEFEPPFRPRRNRLRMWTMAASLFAVVALGAVALVGRYGLPDWMPLARATFAQAQPDLVLDFPPNRQDRRTLPNGTEFFGASGTVTNVGQTRRAVPTILIVLRDARERIVYSYEVAPPKRILAPGESMTVNEAATDVPKSAKIAEIGWKPG